MSLSSADLAVAPSFSLEPESSRIARLRDRAALIVMIGSNIFNVLALIVVSPLSQWIHPSRILRCQPSESAIHPFERDRFIAATIATTPLRENK